MQMTNMGQISQESATLVVRFRQLGILAQIYAHWADVGQEVKAGFVLRQSMN